jgi:hypothetical protein
MQTLVQSINSRARSDYHMPDQIVLVDALAIHEEFFDPDNLMEVLS